MLVHPEGERTLELGANVFLMGGAGSGVLAGPTLFGVFEVGRGWFLRPALFVGRTWKAISSETGVYATLAAGRFDACGRIAAFYIERHGIQVDVCGGGEIGFQLFDTPASVAGSTNPPASLRALPFLALGPSISLRGELGSGLAIAVRGVFDFNVLHDEEDGLVQGQPAVNQSLFVGRGELGLSWELR
jgi:hypothetical protein